MTKVRLDDSGKNYQVVCEGHATGSPEVCAAVSGLMYAGAIYLDEHPYLKCKVYLEDGHAELVFSDRKLFDFLSAGLRGLMENFPKFISRL